MRKLRIVKSNKEINNTLKPKKRKKMTMNKFFMFKKEYQNFESLDETPVQKMKPKKLKNRIIPEQTTTHSKTRVIQNPFELKKLGYEPSRQCWQNYYDSQKSAFNKKDKQTQSVLKKVA